MFLFFQQDKKMWERKKRHQLLCWKQNINKKKKGSFFKLNRPMKKKNQIFTQQLLICGRLDETSHFVLFLKLKHQRSGELRSDHRAGRRRREKTHLVFSVFFGNCCIYFPATVSSSPQFQPMCCRYWFKDTVMKEKNALLNHVSLGLSLRLEVSMKLNFSTYIFFPFVVLNTFSYWRF